VRSYRDLVAWQVAFDLAGRVYRFTEPFPRAEEFGLRAQMRRAAVSIASNLAEGAGREGQREFAQFVSIALGSLNELETQYLLCVDLGISSREAHIEEVTERLYALLNGLRNALRPER
jgi:four helix bundle protein